MNTWMLRVNPELTGPPRLLEVACHDRTPFLSIDHGCGVALHMHESQIPKLPTRAQIAVRCPHCHEVLDMRLSFLREAFAAMRRDGWIA
jgi:hypothetical protein